MIGLQNFNENFFTVFLPYCPAQPQIQLSWAELALILKNPASARPAARPPGRPGLVPEKLPRKLKFDMQASFNPTRTNIQQKIGVTLPPPLAVISSQNSHFVTIQTRHLTKKLI